MPFLKGQPKIGGRKKGTPNKRTLGLADRLEALGFDPLQEIINNLPELNAQGRNMVMLELMQYIYPKRKAIEMDATIDTNLGIQDEQREELKKMLIEIAKKP